MPRLSFALGLAAVLFCHLLLEQSASASIHRAPIVLKGHQIKSATQYPINRYRLFSTGPDGRANAVPFQIDEITVWGDYVLDQGSDVTAKDGNGVFDLQDELAFMGDDVGLPRPPDDWGARKPDAVYEIKFTFSGPSTAPAQAGAVYLAVYHMQPPALSPKSYVSFNKEAGEVQTSRYRYQFDRNNWLVVRGVDMVGTGTNAFERILDSSTFFMRADLKYFLTLQVNHRAIESALEAYRIGPVRSIVRVSFHYRFLRLNFELGMYTEVSFFSNSVILPAVLYNPLDGKRNLNSGSGFYYGFALNGNPKDYNIDTNIPAYAPAGLLDFLKTKRTEAKYWFTASTADRMMYVEIEPSEDMRKLGAVPQLYLENQPGSVLAQRPSDSAKPLGESPVNMGLYFDMTRFTKGEHSLAFRLFFENRFDAAQLESFRNLSLWNIALTRIN